MSSLDVCAKMEELCPEEHAILGGPEIECAKRDLKGSISSRLHDFNLGVGSTITPDPHTEWDPIWLERLFRNENAASGTEVWYRDLGVDKIHETKPPDDFTTPGYTTSTRILRQLNRVEPPGPYAARATKTAQDYIETMETLSVRILVIWFSMREYAIPSWDKLHRTLLRAADQQEWTETLHNLWKEAAEEMHKDLDLEAWGLDFDTARMPSSVDSDFEWVKHNYRGADIIKDDNASMYMSPHLLFQERLFSDKRTALEARAACLAPLINSSDVADPEKLFTLIYERTREHPQDDNFRMDYRWSHVGRASGVLGGLFCGSATAHLQRSGNKPLSDPVPQTLAEPNSILRMFHGFPNTQLIYDMSKDHLEEQDPWDKEKRRQDLFGSVEAHVTLVSQCLIYGFLEKVVRELLPNLSEQEEEEKADYGEEEEDRPPPEYSLVSERCQSRETTLAMGKPLEVSRPDDDGGFSEEGGFLENGSFLEEGSLLVPGCPMLKKWTERAGDQAEAAAKQVEELWLDVNDFWRAFQDELSHHHCWLRPGGNSYHTRSDTRVTGQHAFRWDLYYDVIGSLTRRRLRKMMMWRDIKTLLDKAEKMEKNGAAQVHFLARLAPMVQAWFVYLLSELTRRGNFASSLPVRSRNIFHPVTTQRSLIKGDTYRLIKACGGFPRLLVSKQDDWETEMADEEKDAVRAMHDLLGNPVAVSMFSMKKVVRYLNRLTEDWTGTHMFSDINKDTISTLGVLLNLIERIDMSLGHSKKYKLLGGNKFAEPLTKLQQEVLWNAMSEDALAEEGLDESADSEINPNQRSKPEEERYVAPMIFYAHIIDDMSFESVGDTRLKHCYRIYSWVDLKGQDSFTAGLDLPTSASPPRSEILLQLKKLFKTILESKYAAVQVPLPCSNSIGTDTISLKGIADFPALQASVDSNLKDYTSPVDECFRNVEAPGHPKTERNKIKEKKRLERKQEREKREKREKERKEREKQRIEREKEDARASRVSKTRAKKAKKWEKKQQQRSTAYALSRASHDTAQAGVSGSADIEPALKDMDLEGEAGPVSAQEDAREDVEMLDAEAGDRPMADIGEQDEGAEEDEEDEDKSIISPREMAAREEMMKDEEFRKEINERKRVKLKQDREDHQASKAQDHMTMDSPVEDQVEDPIADEYLPNHHWETLDILLDPDPNDSLDPTDMENAFSYIGYDVVHGNNGSTKYEMNENCKWPIERLQTETGMIVDNRVVEWHIPHGRDGKVIRRGMLRTMGKRMRDHGITLTKIEQYWLRRH